MALTPTQNPGEKDRSGSDEAFRREVDDAVRASNLTGFWKRYGRWLLVALVAGLLAFGGYILWQNRVQAAADKQSEAFVDAIDKLQAGDNKGASILLAKLSKADQPGYRAMAQLVQANLDAEKGEPKKAIAAYAKIAADVTLPQPFRDLALVRQTGAEFDSLPPQKVVDRLKPLAVPGNAWFGSAGEMTAMAYMKMGKDNLAGPIFAQIAKQQNLPQSLRARATQMAGALGVDAVQLDEKKADASRDKTAPVKGDS